MNVLSWRYTPPEIRSNPDTCREECYVAVATTKKQWTELVWVKGCQT